MPIQELYILPPSTRVIARFDCIKQLTISMVNGVVIKTIHQINLSKEKLHTLVAGVMIHVESVYGCLSTLFVPKYQVYPVVDVVRYVLAF